MSDLNVYTTAEINALTPITGDLVLDSDLYAVKLYDGAAWKTFNSDGGVYQNRWGASFDGSNDYLTTTSSPQALFQSDYTLSVWYKRQETVAGGKQIIGTDYRLSGKNIIKLYELSGSLTYNFQVQSASATVTFAHAADTDWHHYAISATQSGNSVIYKAYLDGVYKHTVTSTQTLANYTNPYNLGIGAGYDTAAFAHANIYVDDFAIFESALSDGGVSTGQSAQGNIAALYNGGVPKALPVSAGLYYRMGDDSNDSPTDGGSVSGIQDSAGTNHAVQATASSQPTFSDLTGESIYV